MLGLDGARALHQAHHAVLVSKAEHPHLNTLEVGFIGGTGVLLDVHCPPGLGAWCPFSKVSTAARSTVQIKHRPFLHERVHRT